MKKGFSLIELIIVVVLIGILFGVAASNFKIAKPEPKALTPLNLKESILKSELFQDQATLMCVNKCKTCYLRRGVNSAFEPYANKVDLTNIKAYVIDSSDALVRMEYARFNDDRICLVMDFYNNGSSTQMILENEEGAYFLPAFFGKAKKFDSPEDAKEHWLERTRVVSNSGEYY